MGNPTPDTRWYLRALGQTRGPYTLEQMRRFVAEEMATVDSPVCIVGGSEWQRLGNALPDLFRAPVHSPKFPAPAGGQAFPPPPMPPSVPTSLLVDAGEAEAWTQGWAKICGILLIGGFCWPLYFSAGPFGGVVVWPWNLLSNSSAGGAFWLLLPLFLGVSSLCIGRFMAGRARTVVLFASSVGTMFLFLSIPLQGGNVGLQEYSDRIPNRGGFGVLALALLMLLSACAIAVGNRLRKGHPDAPLPSHMAGLGGCGLVLAFLVPVAEGWPLIRLFFAGWAWQGAWSVILSMMACLAYGIAAIFSFQRSTDPLPLCGSLSLLARAILIAPPILFLFQILAMGAGELFGTFFMMFLKIFALLYGQLLLAAVGLAAWLDDVLREQEKAGRLRV